MSAESAESPRDLYAQRAKRFESNADALEARSRRVSNLRGLAFVVAFFAWGVYLAGGGGVVFAVLGGAATAGFVALVVAHGRVIEAAEMARRWWLVNRNAEARCSGGWRSLPDDGRDYLPEDHPYAGDLDLFGRASLFQRLNVAHTLLGQRALARFLTEPPGIDVTRARQEAARALAPELELRQELEALALAGVDVPDDDGRKPKKHIVPDPEPLLRWAEGTPELAGRAWLKPAAWCLPPITCVALIASPLFDLPALAWSIPLTLQIVIVAVTRGEAARVFTAVSTVRGAFLRYGPMLELLEGMSADAALLRELKQTVLGGRHSPSRAMKRFRRVVDWFDLRHNGIVHPFLNVILLWDANCVLRLEAWQDEYGKVARRWFEVLGELEALSAFAGYAHDHPEFALPELEQGAAHFVAVGLGHPLLDDDRSVTNDVTLPGAGTALLVTGSNMSGKSTLLRSMGLAAVMAMAGAPVCARELRMGTVAVRTSMRISDSLEGGVSHFYAEVGKLKAVLDATAGELPVFFLLDEILHGTNSRERQIGARWVLAELLARGATGAISTHDMELCRLPEDMMSSVQLVHFRESVRDERMTFDYRLREGPVTAGNALRLMRISGIPVPLE